MMVSISLESTAIDDIIIIILFQPDYDPTQGELPPIATWVKFEFDSHNGPTWHDWHDY